MRTEEFLKLQKTCEMYDIKLEREQYLRGHIYYINGKRQKNICEMYKTLVELTKVSA